MADYLPQNSGLWSTTTWITAVGGLSAFAGGNTPPTVIDDVYADGKTITIDTNIFVNTLRTTTTPRTGGLAGGGFRVNDSISLSANSVIPGTTTCLTFLSASPNSCTITGTISGSTTTAAAYGINNNSTGTINIIGDIRASTVAGNYAVNANTANGNIINVLGNLFAGSGNTSNAAIRFGGGPTSVLTITGNIIGGNGYSLEIQTGNITIYGNVFATFFGWSSIFNQSAFNTLTIYGNVSGGSTDNACGLRLGNNTLGNIFIYGSVYGGGGAGSTTGAVGCLLTMVTPANCFVYGDVYGGYAGSVQWGIQNNQTMIINVTGNVIGGNGTNNHGINNASTGRVFVSGSAIGGNGTTAYGVNNTATGLVSVKKAVGNNFGLGSVGLGLAAGVANSQNGLVYVEEVEFGSRGATPIVGPVYILPSNRNTLTGRLTALGNTVTFYNSLSVDNLIPPASSVRLDTVYNVGNSTGTMAVPSASAVQFGVPVDNTVGTAALTPQNVWGYSRLSATQVDSMGDRLRNTATTQSIGYQIASFNL